MRLYKCKRSAVFLVLLLWLRLLSGIVQSEQLPLKTYTTTDGLPGDNVNRIIRDSRGFLWFCTEEGLSRFDGYRFTNYTAEQGMPHRFVSDFLETSRGAYWVATAGGVCRFNPAGPRLFNVSYPGDDEPSRQIEALAEDQSGAIWCGTHGGVYLLEEESGREHFRFMDFGMPTEGEGAYVQTIVADRNGSVWIGTRGSGLYRRRPDGGIDHFSTDSGLPTNRVEALLEDQGGRMWAGTTLGLCQLSPEPGPSHRIVSRVYTTRDGLPSNSADALFQSPDGTLWVGTDYGLSKLRPRAGENDRFWSYTTSNGLSSPFIQALAEDRDGNLWLGTDSGGAMKLTRGGFTNYTEMDGLASAGVDSIFEDNANELCVISSGQRHFINHFDGRRFKPIWPAFPKNITYFGWGCNQITLQDRTGDWWVPTGQGLCRFAKVSRLENLAAEPPKSVYTTSNGLPFNDVFRLFQDSRGDLWISTLSQSGNGLTRWERATETLHNLPTSDGAVPIRTHPASAFAEDAAGNVWIGQWTGGLTRCTAGRLTSFNESDGLPAGTIRALYLDHAHRLWIASSVGGLARIDDPSESHPRFVTYTTAEGLLCDDVWCITENQRGSIFVGTGRGLDELEPDTGHIKHYTEADGLMRGKVTAAYRDRHGALWFASNVHGLSRLVPQADPTQTPPPILISGLRVAGVPQQISQVGESEVPALRLGADQNQLSIDFVGLSFGPGEILRYQYRLEGGADQDWSPPGNERSVNFANLAPGQYRFLVRAVNDEGLASAVPATLSFVIPPPVWRRWWFIAAAAFLLGLAIYSAHRQRVSRLIELERVRTRIATDLHDDIGANLSLIAMLSDVARGQLKRDDGNLKEWFSTIATTSRDTVDAMSDIVWAVNPKRDHLRDLTRRMRRFAEDIFSARDIDLQFHASEPDRDLKLGADLRREVFLIFKESINNMVRHSNCTSASVTLRIERSWLELEMGDDGKGLGRDCSGDGHGLASMRQRAAKLGGSLEIASGNGSGTILTLKVPLDRHTGA
jgi:ligand-binding sensor domain-containing protein/signal transduction histidine kinase